PVRVEGQLAHLLERRLPDLLPVRVADVHGEEPRERVEEALAVHVLEVAPLAADDHGDLRVLIAPHAGEVEPQVVAGGLLEVEELREREEEARISRREFVKRTGALGAAVAVTGPMALARAARAAGAPRIAIVGGGIAGLTAALTLQDKGVFSDVYESSGRL